MNVLENYIFFGNILKNLNLYFDHIILLKEICVICILINR